ncbi:pilus assembly protein [Rhodophyticola sp. CCM32]|uniref:TadE/TadG family type IV pilus assembly protein n=1 Tax=Rhodophyticola sp. CCM32 TaxID=2916397 RepID=UPI00107F297C|nr:TadE/TadG family type IV pilus assembly protein [Rhodophyticola sp. CCM32]QBY00974.1 pilus assembly protein [Rhodophyticola sp. CCM32]
MIGLGHHIRRFSRSERATATTEFVIVFPIILILFIAVFETAMILTRQVMLERALDSTVRYMRLTADLEVTHDQIAENVCANALVIPNCTDILVLDLRVIDQTNYILPDEQTLCVDRDGMVRPANTFDPGRDAGRENQLMLIRVCAVVDRILPLSGFGLNLTRDDTGGVHMTSATIFVNEPS